MNTFDYLIRVNLYLILFTGCYYCLLRRHTFFRLNRLYLLGSAGLALVLPFIELSNATVAALPAVQSQLLQSITIQPDQLATAGPDWELISWWAYGLIAAGLLVRLFWRTSRLLSFILQQPKQTLPDYTLVQPVQPDTPTFSFFRYLVLSPADVTAEPVWKHELVHIRQYHSVDVLLSEVLQALFWYNPILLLYRAALREVHEFLADQQASAQHRAEYADYLVTYALGGHPDTLTNSFFRPSLLLVRLRMLQQRSTSHWALGKYAMILPVAAIVLALTAARPEVAQLVDPLLTQNLAFVKGRVVGPDNRPLPGAIIEVVGTTRGTTTDRDGWFKLSADAGTQLAVSFAGFESKIVKAKTGAVFTVKLAEKSEKQAVQRSKGSAVQRHQVQITKEQPINAKRPESGVNATRTEEQEPAQPGVRKALPENPMSQLYQRPAAQVRIRLNKVTDKGDPLYIVDGVRKESQDITLLSSDDIESISVLKGESARAIYGEEGANGVVIVTSKTGKQHENKPAQLGKN